MENKKVTNLAKKVNLGGHGMTRSALIKMRSLQTRNQILEFILKTINDQTEKDLKNNKPEDYSNEYQYYSFWGSDIGYTVPDIRKFFKEIETKYGIPESEIRPIFFAYGSNPLSGNRGPTVRKLVDFVVKKQRSPADSGQSTQRRA